jgi:hypothetical protein
VIVAAFEAAIGAALVVGLRLDVVIPVTMLALIVLSATTTVAVTSGRTTDCGCYAGYFSPSLPQTLGINGGLFLLLGAALVRPGRPTLSVFQGSVVVIGITVAVIGVTAAALNAWVKRGDRLFDESPIKVGREWKNRWSGSLDAKSADEIFVVYLGPECPFCKRWVPVLNGMNEHAALPPVIGIVGDSAKRTSEYQSASGARFPLKPVSKSLVSRLVNGVPTAILVKNGKIADIWTGEISADFLGRFKQAFFGAAMAG